ncbi:hypothetical protein Tco_0846707 [Tanacetum coccineum]
MEEFSQQKRYAKDPIEIHGIKRRHNKGLQAFIDRFISESSHIKGVPPVLRISAFMHGYGYPELAKKLNDKIPKTVDEMFERVRAFIRREVATGSTEMVHPSKGDKGGHNTNDCYQLKKQIEEVVASGKLAHLVKDIRQNNQRSENRGKNSVKIINMIREGENRKSPYEEGRSGLTDELTFPGIPRYQLTDEPIILEGIIKGQKSEDVELRCREAIWECRQLEKVQGLWKEVQWCQRKEQMSRIREQVILRINNSSERGPNSGPVSLEKHRTEKTQRKYSPSAMNVLASM